MKFTKFLGVVIGAIYAFVLRVLFDNDILLGPFNSFFSFTFIWIVPIVVGVIPILFIGNKIYLSRLESIAYPMLSVFLFFAITIVTGIEDLLCVLIFFFPYFVIAALAGAIVGLLTRWYVKNRAGKKGLYSVLFLPFIFNPIEALLPDKTNEYTTHYSVIINQSKENIWANLIEVPEITEQEYSKGFFNYIGIPRPVKSKLETDENTIYRTGYFTDGLILKESITDVDTLNNISFIIHLDKSSLRNTPTENHALKTGMFTFGKITYTLHFINPTQTELKLSCDYSIQSKMNFYAYFWANKIIEDFEYRLLSSLKIKSEANQTKKTF